MGDDVCGDRGEQCPPDDEREMGSDDDEQHSGDDQGGSDPVRPAGRRRNGRRAGGAGGRRHDGPIAPCEERHDDERDGARAEQPAHGARGGRKRRDRPDVEPGLQREAPRDCRAGDREGQERRGARERRASPRRACDRRACGEDGYGQEPELDGHAESLASPAAIPKRSAPPGRGGALGQDGAPFSRCGAGGGGGSRCPFR